MRALESKVFAVGKLALLAGATLSVGSCNRMTGNPANTDQHVIRRIATVSAPGGNDSIRFLLPSTIAMTGDGQYIVSGSEWFRGSYVHNPPRMDQRAPWMVYLNVWRFDDGSHVWAFRDAGEVYSLALSPDSRSIYTVNTIDSTTTSLKGSLNKWDLATGELVWSTSDITGALVASPDGQFVAAAGGWGWDSRVRGWSATDGSRLWEIDVALVDSKDEYARGMDISPDGQYLLASTSQGGTGIWRLSDKALVRAWYAADTANTVRLPSPLNCGVRFTPDGRYVLAWACTAMLFSVADGDTVRTLELPADAPSPSPVEDTSFFGELRITPDGEYAVGDYFGQINVWRLADGRFVQSWQADSSGITGIAVGPDSRTVVSVGRDGYIVVSRIID